MRQAFFIMMLAAGFCAAPAAAQSIWVPDTTLKLNVAPAFGSVKVIDRRPAQENIGFLKTGAFNRYSDFVTDRPLAAVLETYIGHYFSTSISNNRLLMIIRDFRAEDMKGTEEIGTMHLRAELFAASGDGYRPLMMRDTIYESKSGWDVTKWVRQMPSDALLDVLEDASRLASAPAPANAPLLTEQAAIGYTDSLRQSFPLYTATEYPRGLYRTFDDLLHLHADATPFIDERIVRMEGPATTSFYYKNDRGKKGKLISVKECFAISDGTHLFVTRKDRFTTLVKHDGDFFANLYAKGLTDNSVAMGAAFGLIGTIASSSDQSKHTVLYRCRLVPDEQRFVSVGRVR